jgi:hypothetical protein
VYNKYREKNKSNWESLSLETAQVTSPCKPKGRKEKNQS